jgi:hypothetical protein
MFDKITLMLVYGVGYFSAQPGGIPGLETKIESLAAAATVASAREDARELARDGFRHVTATLEARGGGREEERASAGRFERVESVRAVERACLDGVHDQVLTTAKKLQELKIIGEFKTGLDSRGRTILYVEWLKKPEGLGRRTRQKKRPGS